MAQVFKTYILTENKDTCRILESLNLTDFKVCVECVKEKWTNIRKLGAYRSSGVLELIHTDICEPFPMASWNG